jgi:flagellar basal-body rod modification protein FlgD
MITSTTSTASSGSAAAAAAQTPAVAGGEMGKDQFMKLLIAQMQNQDPTNPMDGSQMASQLAQFSSLEQLQNINTTLGTQSTSSGALLGAMQASSAIGIIGHSVVAAGNGVQIGGANGSSSVAVDVAANTKSATLHILDASGKEVGKRDLGALGAGKQTVDIGSAADGLPAGAYTYSVDGADATGNPVAVQTYMTGKIDGISTGTNGIMLTSGLLTIPYVNVTQVLN